MLASQSPRRREILRQAGIPFTVRAADVDESVLDGESPAAYVQRLAAAKALCHRGGGRTRLYSAPTPPS